MHAQDLAVIKALVPIAWADGDFADREKEMLSAVLDAYAASEAERKEVLHYADTKKTLDDIDLSELSASDRRIVLQHAVVMSFVDGHQDESERVMLKELARKLRIPDTEAKTLLESGAERARKNLGTL